MDNKLTQDYKDNLYEKVLEKKAKRTAKRKRLASICVVFFIVACFATYGYTKYEKENYNNYFITESENIYIDDEYEYFDDLGIKLEFINTDKDSITIGVNIKYENIADYFVNFNVFQIIDIENNEILINRNIEENEQIINTLKLIKKNINQNEIQYFINFDKVLINDLKNIRIVLKELILEDKNEKILIDNIHIEKEISIDD